MSKRTKLGLAGLALLGITSAFAPNVYAKDQDDKPAKVLDNFNYASHRNVPAIDGKCYEGTILNYNLLSNATIAQSDKNGVVIEPIWFYDIDNDGKFGKAEMDAIKAGIPIFMHQAFNDIANEKIREYLQTPNSAYVEKDNTALPDFIDESNGKYDEQVKEIIDEILNKNKEQEAGKYDKQVKEIIDEILNKKQTAQPTEAPKDVPKDIVPISLIFGGNTNTAFNSFSGNLGIRVNPFRKAKELGLAALLDVGFGLDRQIDSASVTYFDDVFNSDITMSGTKNSTNNLSIGGSLEINYGPLVVGGEVDYNTSLEQTAEQISMGDVILKSNSNSVPNSSLSEKVYAGLEIPIGKNYTLEAIGGYDTANGPYFGIRNSIRLNPDKN